MGEKKIGILGIGLAGLLGRRIGLLVSLFRCPILGWVVADRIGYFGLSMDVIQQNLCCLYVSGHSE